MKALKVTVMNKMAMKLFKNQYKRSLNLMLCSLGRLSVSCGLTCHLGARLCKSCSALGTWAPPRCTCCLFFFTNVDLFPPCVLCAVITLYHEQRASDTLKAVKNNTRKFGTLKTQN